MTDRVSLWQCIGCGRIEGPQTCIGVCQYNRVEVVAAGEHEAALAGARREAEVLAAVVRRLAWTTPRDGEWERSYRSLQAMARQALGKSPQQNPSGEEPAAAESDEPGG